MTARWGLGLRFERLSADPARKALCQPSTDVGALTAPDVHPHPAGIAQLFETLRLRWCPRYPQKRTSGLAFGMSALGQNPTFGVPTGKGIRVQNCARDPPKCSG